MDNRRPVTKHNYIVRNSIKKGCDNLQPDILLQLEVFSVNTNRKKKRYLTVAMNYVASQVEFLSIP
jgi:hypothetical protein